MKTRHPLAARISSLLSLGLILAATGAGAQTFFYANADSGSNAAAGGVASDGTLALIGFDMSAFDLKNEIILTDTGSASARPAFGLNGAYSINVVASALSAPTGTVLESVTLYLFLEDVNPNGGSLNFSLFDGINGTGSLIDTLPLAGPDDEGDFLTLTLTGDQFLGGFSILATGLPNTADISFATELSTAEGGIRTPGISATFAPIPEPSAGLLGALGALGLLRRRRP